LEDYERDFVLRIRGLVRTGPDFAELVKDALQETMGEAGSSVLLVGMDKAALGQPARFAQELSRFFGAGAASVLKMIVTRASERSKGPAERSPEGTLADVLAEGPEARFGVAAVRQTYLHDHRIKDELDEYSERIAASDSDS
jgi:ubiquinone biosynthesis protein UbiJ